MKKFFALAILLSASLTEQCFAAELKCNLEKNFYVNANIIILDKIYYDDPYGDPIYGNQIAIDRVRGSIIRGYNYTENVRAELEIMFGLSLYVPFFYSGAFLANLCYYNKIKNVALTPYFGIGVGVIKYWYNKDVSHSEALVQQIKIGVKYQVDQETSISVGYSFIVHSTDDKKVYERGVKSGATSYGLALGVSYDF